MLIEFNNIRGKRLVETANGVREVRDLRELGCPDWLAKRVESRAATKHNEAAPVNTEVEILRAQASALSVF